MGLIFYTSSQSDPAPALTQHVWDKLLHGGGYCVLAILIARALAREQLAWTSVVLGAIILTSLYGASDEVHQMLTPGRQPDILDWLTDTAGGAIGALLFVAGVAGSAARARQ
jgi:VanZ family protein